MMDIQDFSIGVRLDKHSGAGVGLRSFSLENRAELREHRSHFPLLGAIARQMYVSLQLLQVLQLISSSCLNISFPDSNRGLSENRQMSKLF